MGVTFLGLVGFAIPNTILIGAAIFAIAIWLRSTFASFIAIVLILMFYGITQSLIGDLENETFAQLADPFGIVAFDTQTRYWTHADKNSFALTLGNPMLLYNRLIWLGAGLTLLGAACWRFTFAERRSRRKKRLAVESPSQTTAVSLPTVTTTSSAATSVRQLLSQFKIEFFSTIKSPVFLVIIIASMIDTFSALRLVANEGFGLSALPVTYSMVNIIRGGMYVYLLAIIIFYSGVLVWKERESKIDEVYDAMPHSTWISYLSKLLTLVAIVAIVLAAYILMGIINQALAGYTRFQLPVYFVELYLISFVWIFGFITVALLTHVLAPNKYVAYFAIVIVGITNLFVWGWLEVQSNLIRFTSLPTYVYSDMFELKPYESGLRWFGSYWILFALIIACVSVLFWQRGRDRGPVRRSAIAMKRSRGPIGICQLVSSELGPVSAVGFTTTQKFSTTTSRQNRSRIFKKTTKLTSNSIKNYLNLG